jgi:hypothetical protein
MKGMYFLQASGKSGRKTDETIGSHFQQYNGQITEPAVGA